MPPKKRSFFEKLSGAMPVDDYDDFDYDHARQAREPLNRLTVAHEPEAAPAEEAALEGQLPVDMYQTPNEIVIRAFVAGVRPDELNISISRDVVEIQGSREVREQVVHDDYVFQELFWGSFTRSITLPEEIDVDTATANSKDGLLVLTLPKLDKMRQTKLRVKAG